MTRSNYWTRRLTSAQLSRRRFVGGAAVTGVGAAALGLVGCGDDDDGEATATTAPGGSPTAPGATATPAQQAVDGGILRSIWLGGSQFDSTDTHRGFRDETYWLSNYVLNKIIRYSNPDTGDVEADLAEKWETPDSQTYTFTIRKDVKWQNTSLTNGRALTSKDIKWHIERQRDAKLVDGTAVPFRFQSDYTGVTVETPDDYTVKLKLPAPNGAFLTRMAAYFATVPNRETVEKYEKTYNTLTEEAMPATGAFTIKKWRANEDVYVQKNPQNFRKGEPHFDGMILPVGLFADPTAARLAFEQKQIDAWASPDASVTKSILDAHKDSMYEVLTGVANTVFLHLNMNNQFKDVRLVRAMNMAVDRRLMISTFHQGLGAVSGPVTWLQEGFAVKPEDLIKYPGYRTDRQLEIKEARELWTAGGGPALGDVDIRVTDTWLGPYPDTNQIMIKMFNEALGVTQFKSTKCTYNDDIIPNLANGKFPNWMSWTSQVNSPDPRNDLLNTFNSKGSGNFQKVNNADLDKLTNDAILTSDLTKARDLTQQAQKIILDNGHFGNVVLYNYISRAAYWNYLHGNFKTNPSAGKAAAGYNIFSGHLVAKNSYLDPKDPSYGDTVKNRSL
ncbi:MAG: ABC transporter substrate-binding protein [Chloroflexi bacterium]|nr:ABC transporter substrate-binding protein [Chloroflexota bacterium]